MVAAAVAVSVAGLPQHHHHHRRRRRRHSVNYSNLITRPPAGKFEQTQQNKAAITIKIFAFMSFNIFFSFSTFKNKLCWHYAAVNAEVTA